ncbi:MAG: AraC family transcriptional regulator [Oceanospirillaceae bacterium]
MAISFPSFQSLQLNLIRSYWQSANTNWNYPSYQRPYNWLIHTISGHGLVQLDDYSIELKPNTLALLPLNKQCHYHCYEPMQLGACAFTLEMPSGVDIFQLYQPPKIPIHFNDQTLMTKIINPAQTHKHYFEALAATYQLLAPIIDQSEAYTSINHHYQRLEQIFSYIDQRLAQPISVPELASLHGTSTAHFSRWFTQIVEMPPKKYINQRKVDLACKQLLLSDQTIAEIAFNCGFEDPLYFSKSFKKITGLTPRDYRKTKKYDLM